ncbi:hypothetical protein BOX15_Mlig030739g3 [Macrostomum lignano]|uniref:sphingomyelin phosphodiesterase n=1 Tax=Macrostomum lignano TaxID=282301 RepID=A0A267GBI1_9PLAT|nr:hypothetical protein BOX15_Mlig030739g3 [Macrostomum lignano]
MATNLAVILVAFCMTSAVTMTAAKQLWIGTSPFCDGQPRDCPIFDMTYIRSDKYGDGKMCLTGSKVLCESKPLPHDLRDSPANEINIASYNVFERPYFITHDGQTERTCHIPRALLSRFPELDVVIFEEAFMGGCWYDNQLVSMRAIMAAYGFPYYTETVGSFLDAYFIINGGVFIASRWPITSSVRMQFADSGHADKFSKKGAVYARINKMGSVYHIVGTHMQAQIGDSYDKIRVKQAIELQEFLANMKLPSSEPVLIGGDFNCDLNNNPTNANDVISTGMNAEMPEIIGEVRATFDYLTNDVVEPGNTLLEWLDYVVHSRSHKAPKSASLEADRLTADQDITYCNSAPVQPYYVWPWASTCAKVKTTRHLSDHYPVIARFKF